MRLEDLATAAHFRGVHQCLAMSSTVDARGSVLSYHACLIEIDLYSILLLIMCPVQYLGLSPYVT